MICLLMKRLMKRALTFGALLMMLASALPADAQSVTKNSVKLKDGTVIRGQVQRTENGVNVTTEDGLFVYSNDDLWQKTKASRDAKIAKPWGELHGFQASVNGNCFATPNLGFVSGGPDVLIGYRFNSSFLGLGGGFNIGYGIYNEEENEVDGMWTVYLQWNYYFRNDNRKFHPYVGMTLGVDSYDEEVFYDYYEYYNDYYGYYWDEGWKYCANIRGLLGFEYRFARNFSLNMCIGPGVDVGAHNIFVFTAHVGLTFCASK
jgi:hypothetical protein